MNHTGEQPVGACAPTVRRQPGTPTATAPDDRLAPCVGPQGNWFFSEDAVQIEKAKKLCGTCPHQADCLAGALERREPWGVWGGRLLHLGAVVSARPTRGRPRKDRPAGRPRHAQRGRA
jgi:WhiB family redox-sensing transcriptional regulator